MKKAKWIHRVLVVLPFALLAFPFIQQAIGIFGFPFIQSA
jgi:hypothetical protein